MSNLVNIVSPHQRSRLLCLPILLVLLFLGSPAMTWSRVTHQRTEMAFSSCSPMNRIKVFHKHKKKRHKQRCALLGLDRPVLADFGRGGWEIPVEPPNRPQALCFPCTQSLPQRKVESSFGGLCCMAPFLAMGQRSSSFYWVQKTWTLGRSPVSPPMVLNFKMCTWTPSELWLGTCCQVRELFLLPDLTLEAVSK